MARLGVSVGLLYCLGLVAKQAIGLWNFRHEPLPGGVEKAIAWDPDNPRYHVALGRFYERSPEAADREKAISSYESAVRLSPFRPRTWADLASTYELAGQTIKARHAYERARQLAPTSPGINWRLANFYLRGGQTDKALGALQKALAGDPDLRRPAFDLAWRAGVPADSIRTAMIPANPGAYLSYLRYLIQTERLDEAEEVWKQLIQLNLPFRARSSFFYLDALIREQRVDALTSAWQALRKHHPQEIPPSERDATLIRNGDFENEILNGGLGWRVQPIDGVVVRLDRGVSLNGSRSLRIQFDGERNLHYRHVFQYVPVQPNTDYRLVGHLRVRQLTTDSGPRFEVLDAYGWARLSLSTIGMTGTSSWSRQQLQFRTGEETRLLLVRIARPASKKLNNKIAGTVWVDRVDLYAME